MTTYYTTSDGDLLDWICWKHYQQISLATAALSTDPRIPMANALLQGTTFTFNTDNETAMRGTVEAVLQANLGLADEALVLPAGLRIVLPGLDQAIIDSNVVKLWD
ncbi:MAG: tail protein X [Pseudomonadales bacterium]